jgi:D-beta-D-heptose 7-phosphate kinase/D-beta-D-heptose 1-phosphate adenosyltransferase
MKKILVIGELGEDVFVYGEVKRICPEAPVPVLNPIREVRNPGMAGNVVENLRSLDPDADIIHWHQENGITKTRYVEERSNQMLVRIDSGESEPIAPLIFLTPRKNDTIEESDLIILSDYNKGYLLPEMISKISKMNKLTILDTKKKLDESVIEDVTFIKLNEHEYQNNKELVSKYPEKFIVTLGSKGCKYNDVIYPSPRPQETIDVSGAGDTFVASFSIKYLETQDIEKSLIFANEMSSIVVSKKGVSTPK